MSDERSQHKNKARAMSLLQAKLLDQAQASNNRKNPMPAASWWAVVTGRKKFAPTIIRRGGS